MLNLTHYKVLQVLQGTTRYYKVLQGTKFIGKKKQL